MKKTKPLAKGEFLDDIYVVTDRYPLDTGQCYTKQEIDDMFKVTWKKGTKLLLWNDGTEEEPCLAWYLEDGDGGWSANWSFAKKHIKKIN